MRKGFTLVELIAVIAILGAIIVIGAPKLLGTINGQKEKSYEKVKEIVIAAARNYVIDEDINESVSIPISDLCRYVDCPIINPVTETEIQGCINVTKTGGIDSYTYSTDCGYTELVVDLNGGSTLQKFQTNYVHGETITLYPATKEDEIFLGWNIISGDSTLAGDELTIGNIATTIRATYGILPTLLVNLDGGVSNQTFESGYMSGTTIELIEPSKTGYVFTGWRVERGNGTISGNILTIGTVSTLIKAIYTPAQYTCSAGTYLSANSTTCSTCPAGSYCPGGPYNFDENIDQGKATCSAGTYSGSGASSCTACGAGRYSGAGASSCSSISAGCYGTSGSSACPSQCSGRTQYSTGGASSCSTVSSGYYTTGCTGSNRCTGQSRCTAGNYCSNGVSYACASGYTSGAGATSCTAITCTVYCTSSSNCTKNEPLSGHKVYGVFTCSGGRTGAMQQCKYYHNDAPGTQKSFTCDGGTNHVAWSWLCTSGQLVHCENWGGLKAVCNSTAPHCGYHQGISLSTSGGYSCSC